MAVGDIGSVVETLEFEANAFASTPVALHVSDKIYAIAYQGPDNDGWVKTISVDEDGTNITLVASLEFDTNHCGYLDFIYVAGDIFMVTYEGPDNDGWVATLSISSAGAISAVLDTLEFDVGNCNSISVEHIIGQVFATFYRGVDNDGWVATFTVDNAGTFSAVLDTYEFDTSYATDITTFKIAPLMCAVFYQGPNGDGWVKTIQIENDGTITGVVDTYKFHDNTSGGTCRFPNAIKVSGNMFAVVFNKSAASEDWIYSLKIERDGTIGTTIDTLQLGTGSVYTKAALIASNIVAFMVDDSKSYLKTYTIDRLGTIGAEIDSGEWYSSTTAGRKSMVHIFGNFYGIAYRDSDGHGEFLTIEIENYSTITQKLPSNTPSVYVFVGEDSYTTTSITYIESDEMIYGSKWIIRLDNSDQGLNSKAYIGNQIYVTFGFDSEGEVPQQELWVYKQRFISLEGVLMLELECMDAWGLLAVTNPGLGEFWNYPDQASGEVNEDTDHYDKTILYIMSTIVQNAIGKSILFDDDDDVINDYSPAIRIVNDRSSLRQLVEMTETYLYWGADGNFHVIKPDDHGVVYTYNDDNSFWVAVDEDTLVIPNRVRFYGTDSSGSIISADANDSTSQTALGYVVPRYYYYGVQEIAILDTTAKCQALANATMSKIQDEIAAGYVEAPMHCSQKLYDKITITDTRSGKTTTGYIHRIQRTYNPSAENNNDVYKIAIFLGGQMTGFTPDSGAPSMPMIERAPLESSQTARPHIENMGFTESALLIDQDINDNTTVSADINLDRNKLYTAYVQGSNQTDTVEQWGLTISGTSSDGNVFYSKTHGPHDETITYTAITFFTGSLGGAWQPKITINIFNGTGGVRHFHGKIYYAQIG